MVLLILIHITVKGVLKCRYGWIKANLVIIYCIHLFLSTEKRTWVRKYVKACRFCLFFIVDCRFWTFVVYVDFLQILAVDCKPKGHPCNLHLVRPPYQPPISRLTMFSIGVYYSFIFKTKCCRHQRVAQSWLNYDTFLIEKVLLEVALMT